MNTTSVIRTRATCPRCGNKVATRIDDAGATVLAHRRDRLSSTLCR